ncbi:MAG TPA: APC family permease [Patescibacteria group bacterium]|nr:APC family permease [Patescibacteria group bacterium]
MREPDGQRGRRAGGGQAISAGRRRKLALLPLIAATFFIVCGGPYGTEDIVQKAGYAGALLILLLVPLVWSLPTAMMVSELSAALPEEGGFYVWVTRAMGPFWGFQEAWLTLVGSIFDMALYPTLFVFYISHFFPSLSAGHWPTVLGLGMILVCTVWNVCGTRAVGMSSLLLGIVLLGPFVALVALALARAAPAAIAARPAPLGRADWLGGILIAMWNLMGWDNPSTIAAEVDNPRRTYPLTMAASLALIALVYLAPIAAVAHSGVAAASWTTGGWVDLGRHFGGESLAAAIAVGGVIGAFGTFNALMLSLTRIPLVMTEDGYLPRIFARRNRRTGMPWVAISACAVGWAFAFGLGFVALAVMDVLLSGLSVLLEFAALLVLRLSEPKLSRPFRVPGGLAGAVAVCITPTILIGLAFVRNASQPVGSFNALALDLLLIAAGPAIYSVSRFYRRRSPARAPEAP